jgi:hypothetical protein
MALIKCEACEKEVSEDAVNCPNCGDPVQKKKLVKKAKKDFKQGAYGCLAVILIGLLLIIGSALFPDSEEEVAVKEIEKSEEEIEAIKKEKEKAKAKAKEEEKAKAKAKAMELEKNLENAKYLSYKFQIQSGLACRPHIENKAKFSFEWTDGLLESKFPSYSTKTVAPGILTVGGSKVKFQNAFGAMQIMKYMCDYDVRKKKVRESLFAVTVSPKN